MGFILNMYQAMVNSSGLLSTYVQGYDALRENSDFSLTEQEVILLTISRTNGCEYCMAAHSFLAGAMSGVPDKKLSALNIFTKAMVTKRGLPDRAEVEC